MDSGENGADLEPERAGFGFIEGAALAQQGGQGRSLGEFRHQEVDPVLGAEVEEGRDAGMSEPLQGERLAAQTLPGLVARQRSEQRNLDRHDALRALIETAEHRRFTPEGDPREEPVRPEGLPGERNHWHHGCLRALRAQGSKAGLPGG